MTTAHVGFDRSSMDPPNSNQVTWQPSTWPWRRYAPDWLRTCGGAGVANHLPCREKAFHSRFLKLPQFLMAGERWLGHWSDNFNLLKNFVRVQSEHLPWQVCATCVLVDTNNEVMWLGVEVRRYRSRIQSTLQTQIVLLTSAPGSVHKHVLFLWWLRSGDASAI